MQGEEGERQKRESLEQSTSPREAGSPSAPPVSSLLTPPQRPVPPTQPPSQPRQPSHINFHLQQMAALLAAGASSSLGPPRPSPPLPPAVEAPAPKRIRLTPPLSAVERAAPATTLSPLSTPPAHQRTPDPIALLPPGSLYPAPVDLLSQVGPAVVESGYTHAVVSLELLRMLDWRARRSFVAERESQRVALRRTTEPGALGPSVAPGESGSAAEFIARVSQRIPSLASTQPSSASTGMHLASAGSSPSSVTLLEQLKVLTSGLASGSMGPSRVAPSTAGLTAPPTQLHERGIRLQLARPAAEQSPFEQSHRPRPPAFTPPLTRRESAAAAPSALETLAGLLQAEGRAVPPAPPPLLPPARQEPQTETETVIGALTSLLNALVQQQEPPPPPSDPSRAPPGGEE